MVDKIIALSDPMFHQKNFTNILNTLLNNSYPLKFIFNTINRRLKFHLFKNKNSSTYNNEHNNNNITNYCAIPYKKNFSKKISKSIINSGLKIVFTCNNKLNSFIKTNKDDLSLTQKCNVVYKISCSECNASYVGQTKRQLNTRIKEHRQNINKKPELLSVISDHIINTGHNFE